MLGTGGEGAEDLVQEAYLRLLERTSAGRGPADVRPWLFRVVRNLALDERRRLGRGALPLAGDEAERGAADPGDALERREEAGLVLRQVAALPPRERRAVELDQAGVGAPAIARALDTSPNAVHQALFRARRRLRRARAAGWGLVPLPLVRLMLRVSDGRVPEAVLAAGAPGSAPGRLIPAAGLAGAMLAGLAGGGAVVHTLHHEAHAPAAASRTAARTAPPAARPRARRVTPPAAPAAPRRSAPVRRRSAPRAAVRPAALVAAGPASPPPAPSPAAAGPVPAPSPPAPPAAAATPPPAPRPGPPPPAVAVPASADGPPPPAAAPPAPAGSPGGPPAAPAAHGPAGSDGPGGGLAEDGAPGPGPAGAGQGPGPPDGTDGTPPSSPGPPPPQSGAGGAGDEDGDHVALDLLPALVERSDAQSHDAAVRPAGGGPRLDHLDVKADRVARSQRAPPQVLHPEPHPPARRRGHVAHEEAHGQRGGVPAARHELPEHGSPGRLGVQVERLGS